MPLSARNGTDESKDVLIPSQFLNYLGYIDYKHDGSFPWTTEDVLLSKEYTDITEILGIDCEMVGVGNFRISALGRVSIVNKHGFCIYDTFVDPLEKITDYCTKYSGIRPENLVDAPPVNLVVQKVASIVEGRVLVGHSIHNDLEVLKLNHPIASIRDTATFFQHQNVNKRTPSLKTLVKDFFNATIQEGEHSSIQDAQAALRLYLLFREEWEKDALERRRKANLAETVTDIKCMHVQPRAPDLITDSNSVFIRPNKLVGAYYSSEEYKDIQFRLLMEDVLRPLRQDIRIFKQRKLLVNHFKNIRIAPENSLESTNFEVRSSKTLLVPIHGNGLQDIDWDDRNIFLSGSLLILSPDNFHSIKCAKVIDIGKSQRKDSVILHLYVKFLLDGPSWTITDKDRFQMIESKAFFLPYEFTLNFLQDVDLDTFPMKKYIVDAVTKSEIASNLLKNSINKIDFSILMNNIDSETKVCAGPLDYQRWPSASQLNLDESQYDGLQKALTQELTIIQGPPGTGKSHVSLQIVKLLLTNNWLSGSSPILIVAYTNHALDELLEPILKFLTDKIHGGNLKKAEASLHRVGGGCESQTILPCTMKFKKDKLREKNLNKKLVKTLEKALLKVNGLDFTSKLLHQGIINFKMIPQTILAKLEANVQSKEIFKLWTKSHKEIETNVLSWFGLNTHSIELRPKSLTSIADGLFLLLCKNLEAILSQKLPTIPITMNELKGKSLHNKNQEQQFLIRWGYYLFLVGQLADIIKTTRNELILANKATKELEQYVKENATLKQAKVIGMTTTGAVKYKKMVEKTLKPKIMLVEEAAHVLEAYVVASLTRHCTQLILIGDHKQLRPMIADHDLAKDFLDVSLMERLVQNGIDQNTQNWTQLKVQHRMRSEIAKLICPSIYDELENHSDVDKYPKVKGCSKNLFFVTHKNPESKEARSTSRFNAYEAKYIIGLLSYFTEAGYLPTQITVICTYLAQKTLIENTVKDDPSINQIQISTVDGYQGKQNDLIILSLVRNNNDNNVGFLKTDNRVCVALSRARHGLIIVGNMDILSPCSDTWSKINQILIDTNSIGTELPLNHPRRFRPHNTLVYSTVQTSPRIRNEPVRANRLVSQRKSEAQSLRINTASIPQTGTVKQSYRHEHASCSPTSTAEIVTNNFDTTIPLACGHVASVPFGLDLSKVICNSTTTEKLACGHVRRVTCHERGKTTKCGSVVQKKMECGHVIPVACHKQSTATCVARVRNTFSCGHQAEVPCQNSSDKNLACCVKTTRTLVCGHSAKVPCGLNPTKVQCDFKVAVKSSCGHVRHALCRDKAKTTKCGSVVQKKMKCGHIIPVACHKLSTAMCDVKITKTFSCGHKNTVSCQQQYCIAKITKQLSCGHEVQVFCREKNSKIMCPAVVEYEFSCGHRGTVPCETSLAKNVSCNVKTTRMLACGHYAKVPCGTHVSKVKCDFKILEKLSCGHDRHVLCKEKGKTKKCGSVVEKQMNCGHVTPVACHKQSTATCVAKVRKTFPCGHIEQVFCKEKHSNVKCPAIVKHKYPCGHVHLFTCSNVLGKAKKCNANVQRRLPCGHTQQSACHQNPLTIKCRHLVKVENMNFECHKLMELEQIVVDSVQNIFARIQLI